MYRESPPDHKFAIIMEYFKEERSVVEICSKHQRSLNFLSYRNYGFFENRKNVFEKQEIPSERFLRMVGNTGQLLQNEHTPTRCLKALIPWEE